MAYGKGAVPESVMRNRFGGSFSQRAANATMRQPGGKGGRAYWADVYKPHKIVPSNVRLVPVECTNLRLDNDKNEFTTKDPWKEFYEHFHGHYRTSGICSSGAAPFVKGPHKRPCYGCDEYWSKPKKQKTISLTPKYAFAALVMEWFHKVPQLDEYGMPRVGSQGQPYTRWERCLGQGCPHCRNSLENVYGRVQPWPMSTGHFETLNEHAERAGCLTCGGSRAADGRPIISTAAWKCGNPNCQQPIFDMYNLTVTIEEMKKVVSQPYRCPYCQQVTFPEEVPYCANCSPAGQMPVRATIFDVDILVRAPETGEGSKTRLDIVASSDPRPINPQFAELLEKYTPDLDKIFVPTPLEEQAKLWRYNAPQMPQQSVQTYVQPWGGQPSPAAAPQPMPYNPGVPAGQPMQPAQAAPYNQQGYPPQGYAQGAPAAQVQPPPAGYQPPPGAPPITPGTVAPTPGTPGQPPGPMGWDPNWGQGQGQ